MATKQALQAVKKFRLHQLSPANRGLTRTQDSTHIANPFLPHKNPKTGRWAPPKFSLRRQAELVKKAKATGTLSLLPPGPKFPPSKIISSPKLPTEIDTTKAGTKENWTESVVWTGEVKEKTDEGLEAGHLNRVYLGRKRMFKGHKWERKMAKKMGRRRMLLRDMNHRVMFYKSVSDSSCLQRKYLMSCGSASFQEKTKASETCWITEVEVAVIVRLTDVWHILYVHTTFSHNNNSLLWVLHIHNVLLR
jgi:large subunit ribosomal protein L25